jgi:hypothetical protein
MVDRRDESVCRRIVGAKLDGKCPLTRCREQHLRGQYLGYGVPSPQSVQARGGQHDRVIGPVLDLGQPGVDIAADSYYLQIRAQR